MNKIAVFLLLFGSMASFAQVRGTVSDDRGAPLPFVSILVENTYNGTSSNEKGEYELNISKPGNYTLVFQFLGFKTQKIRISPSQFPFVQNVSLSEQNLELAEVVINTKENPANAIIRNAIAARAENSDRTARFTADFYSRGIFKIKDLPKKILGQEVGDLDGVLDSTRSGILYLSETVSKIKFQKPDQLNEKIIASKVSGNDKGFSYNTARATAFDFYDNTLNLGLKMVSPIAGNAFNYYKYKLEGTLSDDDGHLINKIKVIPKRDNEPVFDGYIYIVEDSWALYAVDLNTTGARMHQEMLETAKLVQNFGFNKNANLWSKNTQTLGFTAGFMGIKFNGNFSYVYSNYDFKDSFEKKAFSKEIVSFEDNSNKKDSTFWKTNRPIPLTDEETRDYVRRDSIRALRESKPYLDSIDNVRNKFKIFDLISGYSHQNSWKKYRLGYHGFGIGSTGFNTVQGWNLTTGFSYSTWKNSEEVGRYTTIDSKINYGISDERLRATGSFYHRFNRQNYNYIAVNGGVKVNQYNPDEPISNVLNMASSLLFKNNYMKLYNKEFFGITYGQNLGSGMNLRGKVEYQQRKPLVNTTDYVLIKNVDDYFSNNPLNPLDDSPAFAPHHLSKANVDARISFGNRYISRPDARINIRNEKYPTLYLGYEQAFAASEKALEYHFGSGRLFYDITMGNKGNLQLNVEAGKFFNAEGISFIDYKHFKGNQTRVGTSESYIDVFNLLPYYTASTNDAYSENHAEYNDNGFIMNKLPILKLLKANLVIGFHRLAVPDRKPYTEYTAGLDHLGFGKFRIFRVDYIRSYQNGFATHGVVFGLKFLNVVN